MEKLEYTTAINTELADVPATLTNLGNEGWELTSTTSITTFVDGANREVLISVLKRPKT